MAKRTFPKQQWRVTGVVQGQVVVEQADFCELDNGDLLFTEQIDGRWVPTAIYARGTWERCILEPNPELA